MPKHLLCTHLVKIIKICKTLQRSHAYCLYLNDLCEKMPKFEKNENGASDLEKGEGRDD